MRAIAFPIQTNPQVLATGGAEKKLRIFDLSRGAGGTSSNGSSPPLPPSGGEPGSDTVTSYEIGPGVHGGTIKSIIWNQDYNIVTTAAEDRKVRWWDLRSRHPVLEYAVEGPIGTCELDNLAVRPNDPGILTVAAGKSVYLFDGLQPGRLLKKIDFNYEVASAAVNSDSGRLVTGSAGDTWARVYDLHTEEELGMFSFFSSRGVSHFVNTTNVLLQRSKKATTVPSGQSASRLMANSTALAVKTVLSSCGRHAGNHMVFGGDGVSSYMEQETCALSFGRLMSHYFYAIIVLHMKWIDRGCTRPGVWGGMRA